MAGVAERRQPQRQPEPHPKSLGELELDPPLPPVSTNPERVLLLVILAIDFPHLASGLALLERGRRVLPTPPRPPPPLGGDQGERSLSAVALL